MSVVKDPRLRWLFIGSSRDAKNLSWLKQNNIRYILNATCEVQDGGVPNYHKKDQNFEYCRIKLSDNDSECLSQHYQQIWRFFERILIREDGCVLVHCKLGISRSASCLLAFLIKFMRVPYSSALNLLIASRSEVCPNSDFRQQLQYLSDALEASGDYFTLPFKKPDDSLLLSGRFADSFHQSASDTGPSLTGAPRRPIGPCKPLIGPIRPPKESTAEDEDLFSEGTISNAGRYHLLQKAHHLYINDR